MHLTSHHLSSPAMAAAGAVALSLLLLLQAAHGGASGKAAPAPAGHVPVRAVVYRAAAAAGDEPAYQPFQLCMGCRCCAAANASSCVETSCCYAIDCDVPGKPFGVCAFSPRTCGCGQSGNCTAQD